MEGWRDVITADSKRVISPFYFDSNQRTFQPFQQACRLRARII